MYQFFFTQDFFIYFLSLEQGKLNCEYFFTIFQFAKWMAYEGGLYYYSFLIMRSLLKVYLTLGGIFNFAIFCWQLTRLQMYCEIDSITFCCGIWAFGLCESITCEWIQIRCQKCIDFYFSFFIFDNYSVCTKCGSKDEVWWFINVSWVQKFIF